MVWRSAVAAGDPTRNTGARLEPARQEQKQERDREIEGCRRREGLIAVERIAFDLAARGGDLHDADRQRNRRILEDAEEFGRQGRDNDAKSERQEHITVGLSEAHTRSQGGRGQAGRYTGDSRANLL